MQRAEHLVEFIIVMQRVRTIEMQWLLQTGKVNGTNEAYDCKR